VPARKMLDALISGTHDPDVLADVAKGTLRKKIPALKEALEGRFTGHHALLAGQMLAQIDFLDETIATLSEQIEELTRPFSNLLTQPTDASVGSKKGCHFRPSPFRSWS
jgi:transposase